MSAALDACAGRPRASLRQVLDPAALLLLLGMLACSDDQLPTQPSLARSGKPVPLTATPSSLDFASPSAASQGVTAKVQYTTTITAGVSPGCASVTPASSPATKPPGGSVYVANFTVTPTAVGQCTLTLTDRKGAKADVPVNVGAAGHMFFVAHEDDDLLFMNPDILHAIAAGDYVTTVYLTAGSCFGDKGPDAYFRTREDGVQAAYATMAGEANEWTNTGRPIRELRLNGNPKVSLVFFRLSASKSEAGDICDQATTNLRGLFNGAPVVMTSLDTVNSYTRSQLVTAVTQLLQRWHPVTIGTLDATGLYGTGGDPSGLQIPYSDLGGRCYYYDHSDHYYSARFVADARGAYQDVNTLTRYRGYNGATAAANVAAGDATNKSAAFEAYAGHDFFVPDAPPFGGLYDPWILRQLSAPAPVLALCPVLAFAQSPSTTATLGTALATQPIVQLRDATGADLATSGVPVTLTILTSGLTPVGSPVTETTDINGQATFSGVAISGSVAGQYFLDFTSTGYTELLATVDASP